VRTFDDAARAEADGFGLTRSPDAAERCLGFHGWRADGEPPTTATDPVRSVVLRAGDGRRVGEGEGRDERAALLAALVDALGREARRRPA
jgi:hypothetical protein